MPTQCHFGGIRVSGVNRLQVLGRNGCGIAEGGALRHAATQLDCGSSVNDTPGCPRFAGQKAA